MTSEIVLTADTFAGVRGYENNTDATEYELLLYDAAGKPFGQHGIAKRLLVPAMHTTVIPVRELTGKANAFFGGVQIRLRPRTREGLHASDLFSSAFVRWQAAQSFDNVHANPDPRQWQNTESYLYSMPFPALREYECVLSLFNPNATRSVGEVALYDPQGKQLLAERYELAPHASLSLALNARAKNHPGNGRLAVRNEVQTAKSFGYLMMRQGQRFSVEHPIHQGLYAPKPSPAPFDAQDQFKAKNVLYSPLLFKQKKLGGLTFNSRFYLGTGIPLNEPQWFFPFAVDDKGEAVWMARNDTKLVHYLPDQTERGVIKLAPQQSCQLDFQSLSLPANFAGGLAVAVAPDTTHTLLKAEVRIPEWNAYAFTHFRPGLRSARSYQKAKPRGGLATDYLVSGARLVKTKSILHFDEVLAVLNIDDQGLEASPVVELFDARGLLKRLPLGKIAPFACRHFILSELLPGNAQYETMSLRLIDEHATLLMSVIHLDHQRRDLALDHGSDRFSTFFDYGCQ